MKSFEELFEEFKNNNDVIEAGKEFKKEIKKRNKISLIICLIFDIPIIILGIIGILKGKTIEEAIYFLSPIIILNLFFFLAMFIMMNQKQNIYKSIFKNNIIKSLLNNFFDDVEYFPEKEMTEDLYDEGQYFKEFYNRYWSDDYIKAKINKQYDINMAEVLTQHETTDSDGNTDTKTIFHGIYSRIKIDKSINSYLRITSNYHSYPKKLEMDSSEFEKKFNVFASDKIIGMQLLTSDIMEELLDFKNKTKYYFDVFINQNTIYLRFHCGAIFEATRIKKDSLDEEGIKRYYDILELISSLTKRLIKIIDDVEI